MCFPRKPKDLVAKVHNPKGTVPKSALKRKSKVQPARESVPATTMERAEMEDAFDREGNPVEIEFTVTRPTAAANRWSALGLHALQQQKEAIPLEAERSGTSIGSRISLHSRCSHMAEPEKRGTKISFGDMNEIQEYEKESAIDTDDKLRQHSSFKRPSHLDNTSRPTIKSVVHTMQAANLWSR